MRVWENGKNECESIEHGTIKDSGKVRKWEDQRVWEEKKMGKSLGRK